MTRVPDHLKSSLTQLLLSIADDKLMLGHRASDWTGLGPILEEDIAFSAISQEEIAHAAALYEVVAKIQGGRADAIAFGRSAGEYRCADLTFLADEFDWARAIVRQFFCDHLDVLRLGRLSRSSVESVDSLARRMHAEEMTHVEHADTWVMHLGRGDDESRRRVQEAVDHLVPLAATLFEKTEGVDVLEREGVYPPNEVGLFEQWSSDVSGVVTQAGLTIDTSDWPADRAGGRRGAHDSAFESVLDEMCEVFRVEPEAAW